MTAKSCIKRIEKPCWPGGDFRIRCSVINCTANAVEDSASDKATTNDTTKENANTKCKISPIIRALISSCPPR